LAIGFGSAAASRAAAELAGRLGRPSPLGGCVGRYLRKVRGWQRPAGL